MHHKKHKEPHNSTHRIVHSDNSNDRWKCLVSWAAARCVWTL